ncbi:hypothetical protein D9619_009869 [Psilocybe cf. subviscida]|uniref:F-box domain-containing protein n=1 Tax=Psilocybe cf. subviscida TaxID=2480587 RepID=A0A8H5BLA8_9AGAR|nr:hypothetical protein D9619_009869 [Psilocybe cf. subviscida]
MPPFPNLTHLYLYSKSVGEVSGVHFLETLNQMQNLQDLVIDWKKANLRQFPPTPRPRPIHLPSLQRLIILDGYPIHVESFLPLVTHPKLHQLSVDISSSVTNIAALIQSVLSSIGKGTFSPLESLIICFNNDMGITVSAQHLSSSYYGTSSIRISIPIDQEMLDITDDGRNFELLVDIMSCITPFDCLDKIPLRHLQLDGWDLPTDEFTRLFAFLPHLETIEFNYSIPKLWSITWNGEWLNAREEVPTLSPSVFDDLYGGLLSRHAHGTAITKLRLVACERLDETQVRQLEEIGVKLTARYDTLREHPHDLA